MIVYCGSTTGKTYTSKRVKTCLDIDTFMKRRFPKEPKPHSRAFHMSLPTHVREMLYDEVRALSDSGVIVLSQWDVHKNSAHSYERTSTDLVKSYKERQPGTFVPDYLIAHVPMPKSEIVPYGKYLLDMPSFRTLISI